MSRPDQVKRNPATSSNFKGRAGWKKAGISTLEVIKMGCLFNGAKTSAAYKRFYHLKRQRMKAYFDTCQIKMQTMN